jgi:hypothetical protein
VKTAFAVAGSVACVSADATREHLHLGREALSGELDPPAIVRYGADGSARSDTVMPKLHRVRAGEDRVTSVSARAWTPNTLPTSGRRRSS